MSEYKPDTNEQQRVVIATAIIGTVIALYALPVTGTDLWSYTRGFMVFPAIFAFLFLISTGSHLKYKNAGQIGEIDIAHSLRKFFYNWMIDMFGTGLVVSIMLFTAVGFGWDGRQMGGGRFWSGVSLGFVIAFLLMIVSLILRVKEERKLSKLK